MSGPSCVRSAAKPLHDSTTVSAMRSCTTEKKASFAEPMTLLMDNGAADVHSLAATRLHAICDQTPGAPAVSPCSVKSRNDTICCRSSGWRTCRLWARRQLLFLQSRSTREYWISTLPPAAAHRLLPYLLSTSLWPTLNVFRPVQGMGSAAFATSPARSTVVITAEIMPSSLSLERTQRGGVHICRRIMPSESSWGHLIDRLKRQICIPKTYVQARQPLSTRLGICGEAEEVKSLTTFHKVSSPTS